MNTDRIIAQNPVISINPDTVNAYLADCNDSVTKTLSITNNGDSPLMYNILQNTTFTEDFENGLSNWILTGSWGLSATAYQGGYSLSESPSGNYGNYWDTYATLKDSIHIWNKDSALISFYIRHALECSCDYLYAQISVNNGPFINLASFTCNNTTWFQHQVDFSSYVNNGDYIKFRFYFHTDYSVVRDGTYIDDLVIKGAGTSVPWLFSPVPAGIVPPGQTMNVDLVFRSLEISGTYSNPLTIQTNDTTQPIVTVPCYLEFNGFPVIGSTETTHDFGDVMEYTTKTDTIYITNTGCDILVIDSIYIDQPEYTVPFNTFTLASGKQKAIPVTFNPEHPGYFGAGLYIYCNDTIYDPTDPLLTLEGNATQMPVIAIDPDTIFVDLNCGDSTIIPLTVTNNGGSDLTYQLLSNGQTNGLILYYPMDGNAIDMSGNHLDGYLSGAVPVNDRFNLPGRALSFDGTDDFIDAPDNVYFNGNFTVTAWVNVTAIQTWSRLFDFGNGMTSNNVLGAMSSNSTGRFVGEIYENSNSGGKVYSPVSVPMNEWVFLTFLYENGEIRLYKNGTLWNSGSSAYAPQNIVRTMNYIARSNWSADSYYRGSIDDFRIYNQALDPNDIQSLYNNQATWFANDPVDDTLAPNTSEQIQFSVKTTNLNAGIYNTAFTIYSNDPLHSNIIVPVILNVTGNPDGMSNADTLLFDTIMQHTSNEKSFKLYNNGCDSLFISGFNISDSVFAVNNAQDYSHVLPHDSATITVKFQPQDTGIFEGTLIISTNDGPFELFMSGYSTGAPIIEFNPDSISAFFANCNDSGLYYTTISNTGLIDLEWEANSVTDTGSAIGFNAYGQWVTLGNLGVMPQKGTIEFWQWSNILANYNNSFCTNGFASGQGNRGIRVEENSAGVLGVIFGDDNGSYNGFSITTGLQINSWHHIAIKWDIPNNIIWTYFDGVPVLNGEYNAYWASEWTDAYIGAGYTQSRWWNGKIDEFRIWNVLKSEQEIQDNMHKALTGNENNLLAYWNMNEGAGNVIHDKTAHNHDGTTTGALWSTSAVPEQSFITVDPVSGTLAPGGDTTIEITVNSAGYVSGNYLGYIKFTTNDPLNTNYNFPVEMTVTGNSQISVSPLFIDFGDVMQNLYKTDSILIKNSGCADLLVTDAFPNNDTFSITGLPLTIGQYDSAYVMIRFGSAITGQYSETITLNNNDTVVEINVSGNSFSAPVISVIPDYLDVYVQCNDSVMVPITIYNTGGSVLTLGTGENTGLNFNFGVPDPPLCSPGTYSYCCDIGIYNVNLNSINNNTGPLGQYMDYSESQKTILSPGGTYTLNVTTGDNYDMDVYAWIDFNNNGEFESDENIMASLNTFQNHSSSFTVPESAIRNYPLRMRVGSDYYSEPPLTSCNEPYYGEYEDYSVLIQSLLTYEINQDTIEAGDSLIVDIWFNATNINSGDYYSSFNIASNDPLTPVFTIQTHIFVDGIPGFASNPSQLDFGEIMQNNLIELPLIITNTGCNTLEVWDSYSYEGAFHISSLSFNLAPGTDTTIIVGFEPYDPVYFENDLVFITNAGDQFIHTTGTGLAPPEIWVETILLDALVNCGDSTSVTTNIFNYGNGVGSYAIERCQDITDGLLMYYPFNGNENDYSGFDRNLENDGAVLTEGIGNGEVNYAFYFSDSAKLSYNNIPDITDNVNPEVIGVSLWAKINSDYNSLDPEPCLFNLSGSTGDNEGIMIQCINDSVVVSINVNNVEHRLSAPAIFNEYFMIAVLYDWYNLNLFINGQFMGDHYIEGPISYDTNYNKVGIGWCNAVPGTEHYFVGAIDDVRVYNRTLNWEEFLFLSGKYQYIDYDNISFDPETGTIGPGNNQVVNANIKSDNALAGDNFNFYYINSDDPTNPHNFITVHTWVDSEQEITVSPLAINFDSVYQFVLKTDSVLVENPSCTTLYIWDIFTESPNFYPVSGSMDIPPHSSSYAYIGFNPQQAGELSDNLHLVNDVTGEEIVALSGICKTLPVITPGQNSVNTYLACVETKTEVFKIFNSGLADLTVELSVQSPVNWIQLGQTTATIPPGDSVQFDIYFDRTGLGIALYSNAINITSNDPFNGFVEIPIYMLIPNPLIGANLGVDTAFCTGDSVVLYGGSYSTYLWSDGSTASTLAAHIVGQYWLRVTDHYDCPSSDTINVSVVEYPVVIACSDTTICANQSVQLNTTILNGQPSNPDTAVIGSGISYNGDTGPNPFGTYYMDHKVQMLYKAQELSIAGIKAGNITSLGFVIGSVGNPGMNGLNIKIGTTTQTSLSGFVGGLTNVYSISYYYPHTGQNIFILPIPFFWNGYSNLIVEVCFDNNSWNSNSTFQYTNVAGSVWCNFCDNCAAGCNLSGGSSNSARANLVIVGDGEKNRYYWTGPGSYLAHYRNPVIENVQTSQEGWYFIAVDNGYGCYGYDSTYLTVLPTPTANAGPDLNILGYDSTTISASVTGGISPYSYQWSPIDDLDDPLALQPKARPLATRTYTLLVTGDNNCSHSDPVTINVTPRYSVSGQVTYNNAYYTALSGVKIILKNSSQVPIDSTETDIGGNYIFPLVVDGNYNIAAATTAEAGGTNATDALGIARHTVFISTLSGIRLLAADVNSSQTVNATDALLVLHRTVNNITTFPAGDWVFEKKNFDVNGNNAIVDIPGLCMGDVNASFIPYAKMSASVELAYEGVLQCAPDEIISIPVSLSENTEAGAITIGIDYPESDLEIMDIIPGLPDMIFNIKDGIIYIAWNNSEGRVILKDQPIFEILANRVHTANSGLYNFSALNNCEIAGPDESLIFDRNIIMPRLVALESLNNGFYLGQNRPNPANQLIEIPYIIPEEGIVKISLFDQIGEEVQCIVNQRSPSGYHIITADCSYLPNGVYLYRLIFDNGKTSSVQSRRMVISK